MKLKTISKQAGKGVIVISSGSHAQGGAYQVQKLSIFVTIAMAKATPFTEIVQTRGFGTRVILEGESVNDGERFANNISAWEDLVFVHPYDDPDTYSGQGIIDLEIFQDSRPEYHRHPRRSGGPEHGQDREVDCGRGRHGATHGNLPTKRLFCRLTNWPHRLQSQYRFASAVVDFTVRDDLTRPGGAT